MSTTDRRTYWREAQRRSRWRRRNQRKAQREAQRWRRRTGRTMKIYCDSAKCNGHWLSVDDLDRERTAGRSYFYQRMFGRSV